MTLGDGEGGVFLGGVPLGTETEIEWARTRGTRPYMTSITAPAQLMGRLAALPYETTLTYVRGSDSLNIAVRLVNVTKLAGARCQVTIADPRHDLARAYATADFNVRVKDLPEEGRDADGYGTLVVVGPQYLLTSSLSQGGKGAADVPHSYSTGVGALASSEFAGFPGLEIRVPDGAGDLRSRLAEAIPDNTVFAGMTLASALDILLDEIGADLTVAWDGSFLMASRKSDELPDLSAPRWKHEVPWSLEGVRRDTPSRIVVLYETRRQLDADIGITSSSDPPVPSLRQVYRLEDATDGASNYVTLDGLVTHLGRGDFAPITDGTIRANILGGRWTGTEMQLTPYPAARIGTITEATRVARARRIVAIIERDWRLLWQIAVPAGEAYSTGRGDLPGLGLYSDIEFGRVRSDAERDQVGSADGGYVVGDSVVCDWVDFLRTPKMEGRGDLDDLDGAPLTTNTIVSLAYPPTESSPFTPIWDNGEAGRRELAVRLVPHATKSIRDRLPGLMDTHVEVSVRDDAGVLVEFGEEAALLDIQMIEVNADFDPPPAVGAALVLRLSLMGTSRYPMSRARYWEATVSTSDLSVTSQALGSATGEPSWFIPPDPSTPALFGYSASGPDARPINETAIAKDAALRARNYLDTRMGAQAGVAVADGLSARHLEVDGAVEFMTVRYTPLGEISMEVVVGRSGSSVLAAENRRARRLRDDQSRVRLLAR